MSGGPLGSPNGEVAPPNSSVPANPPPSGTDGAAQQAVPPGPSGQPTAADDLSGSVAGGGDSGELGAADASIMPDLEGKSVTEARAATVTLNVVWTDLGGAPIAGSDAQLVCQQSPAAGTAVIGDSIALKIADSC